MLNPPADCFDLRKYYEFFKVHGEVVYLSLTVRNGTLLRKLADKIVLKERLRGVKYRPDWKNSLSPFMASLLMIPKKEELEKNLQRLEEEIRDLCDEKRPRFRPFRVFAVYNTEHAKRDCIDGKRVSYLDYHTGKSSNPYAMFEGKLMRVVEPGEPSDILYDVTDATFFRRVLCLLISFMLCFGLIIVSFFIVREIQASGSSAVPRNAYRYNRLTSN